MPGHSIAVALAVATWLVAGAAHAAASAPSLSELRGGGFVVFVRHAATDPATEGRDGPSLGDCEVQRILSEAGRADARAIGEAIRVLGIPVGEVRTSPWCRCVETARLAFGRGEIEPMLGSIHGATDDQAQRTRLVAALRTMLSRRPPAGTNTIIVGHGFNLAGAARIPLAQGESAIFRPLGAEGFQLVGKVGARDWARLSAGRSRPHLPPGGVEDEADVQLLVGVAVRQR